jgi:hypothetical protein
MNELLAQIEAEKNEKEALEARKAKNRDEGEKICQELGIEVRKEILKSWVAVALRKMADAPAKEKLAMARLIADCELIAVGDKIKLPQGRFGHTSRGKSWIKVSGGRDNFLDSYTVGAGKYTVGSSDGYTRKEKIEWKVENIQVGNEVWTVAI